MRVFAAVLPPEEVVEHLLEFLEPRAAAAGTRARGDRSGWRWSRREHLHLTLAFVPDLDLGVEEPVIEAGKAWAQRQRPLDLQLSGAGAFPDPVAAKVLWVAVASPEGVVDAPSAGPGGDATLTRDRSDVQTTLSGWAHGIRGLISHAGGRPEGRAFRPHVTVGRTGSPGGQDAARMLQSLDTYESPAWRADTISLITSTLGDGPRGTPRYDVLHEWSLGAGR